MDARLEAGHDEAAAVTRLVSGRRLRRTEIGRDGLFQFFPVGLCHGDRSPETTIDYQANLDVVLRSALENENMVGPKTGLGRLIVDRLQQGRGVETVKNISLPSGSFSRARVAASVAIS
jgi:hypothetical protein